MDLKKKFSNAVIILITLLEKFNFSINFKKKVIILTLLLKQHNIIFLNVPFYNFISFNPQFSPRRQIPSAHI